jgi:hypothetical protein
MSQVRTSSAPGIADSRTSSRAGIPPIISVKPFEALGTTVDHPPGDCES